MNGSCILYAFAPNADRGVVTALPGRSWEYSSKYQSVRYSLLLVNDGYENPARRKVLRGIKKAWRG